MLALDRACVRDLKLLALISSLGFGEGDGAPVESIADIDFSDISNDQADALMSRPGFAEILAT